jgi:hypothetical protein
VLAVSSVTSTNQSLLLLLLLLQGPADFSASVLSHPLEEPAPVVADCLLLCLNTSVSAAVVANPAAAAAAAAGPSGFFSFCAEPSSGGASASGGLDCCGVSTCQSLLLLLLLLQGPADSSASVLSHPLEEPAPVVADCAISSSSRSNVAAYAGWSQESVVWTSRELPYVATYNEVRNTAAFVDCRSRIWLWQA